MRHILLAFLTASLARGACLSSTKNDAAYACRIPAVAAYVQGLRFVWIPDVSSAELPTLSVNGLPALPVAGGPFQGGRVYQLWFDGAGFQADPAQRVSVRDFGAKGDGLSDDTAAFQAALNTLALVFVPAGTYNIGNLQIVQDMQGMEGEGIASKLQTSGAGVAITVTGEYHILSNFYLAGTSANSGGIQFGSSVHSMAFTRLTGVQIRGFRGAGAFGVGLYAVQELNIQDCPLDGNYNDVAVLGGPRAYTTTTVIGGIAGHIGNATNVGVYVGANTGELTLRDAVIESNAREDILVESGVQVSRLILDSCYFEGGNKSGQAQALIAIRGKAGLYRESGFIARNNIFHMPARKSVTLFLDHAISQIHGNFGILETGGAVTTADSRTSWIFNNESPSAADLRSIYAALPGVNYVLDRSYGSAPVSAFQMGAVQAYPGGGTAPAWGRYRVKKVGCANPRGCWQVTDPLGKSALQDVAGSRSQQVSLFTLPANGFVSHSRIATVTAFTGSDQVTATLGFAGAPTALLASGYDLTKAPAPGNLADGAGFGSAGWSAEQTCVLALTTTGSGLDRIAVGAEVSVWAEWAVLP